MFMATVALAIYFILESRLYTIHPATLSALLICTAHPVSYFFFVLFLVAGSASEAGLVSEGGRVSGE